MINKVIKRQKVAQGSPLISSGDQGQLQEKDENSNNLSKPDMIPTSNPNLETLESPNSSANI